MEVVGVSLTQTTVAALPTGQHCSARLDHKSAVLTTHHLQGGQHDRKRKMRQEVRTVWCFTIVDTVDTMTFSTGVLYTAYRLCFLWSAGDHLYLLCLREGCSHGWYQDISASLCQLPMSPSTPQIHITLPPEVPVLQTTKYISHEQEVSSCTMENQAGLKVQHSISTIVLGWGYVSRLDVSSEH